jgi:hypothetical protein
MHGDNCNKPVPGKQHKSGSKQRKLRGFMRLDTANIQSFQ